MSAITIEEIPKNNLGYPKGVCFIVLNEFFERFNNHGIRTILVLYMVWKLGFEESTSMMIFHGSLTFIYICCLVGAIIADSWWGNFKTILILSIISLIGSSFITLASIEILGLPAIALTIVGIFLKSLGTGGIKSCTATFGAEQFQLPEQDKQLSSYFSYFYVSLVLGGLTAIFITPILRAEVQCFGMTDCFPLAFGIPTLFMAISIVILLLGNPYYRKIKPQKNKNMFLKICGYFWFEIRMFLKQMFSKNPKDVENPTNHKFDENLQKEAEVVKNILVLFLPVPIFWTLYEQHASRWIYQASKMEGDLGSINIKPEHMLVLESVLVILFIPLCETVFYPFLEMIGIKSPLQKMTLGGLCPAISFVISGILEMYVPGGKVHILWQIPQHIFMALAEVLFSIPGLEFSFTQAPPSMKSVLMGFWHLTVAIGNIMTIFIAGSEMLSSQVVEYFVYAGLMVLDMIVFAWLASRYKKTLF